MSALNYSVDIRTARFPVTMAPGSQPLFLSWPSDRYYALVSAPVTVVHMDLAVLTMAARMDAPDFPNARRVASLAEWFARVAAGTWKYWPPMPVLSGSLSDWSFVDGRHRCEVLASLGAVRMPVILG